MEREIERGRFVPAGVEMAEFYDRFPGTMRPCGPGKMSNGGEGGGGRGHVRDCDNNYRAEVL